VSYLKRKSIIFWNFFLLFFLVGFFLFIHFESPLSDFGISKGFTQTQNKQVLDPEELTAKPGDLLKGRSLGTGAFLWATLKMLVVLVIVCAFAVLVLRWFLPRLSGFKSGPGDIIQVIRRFPLEQRKTLYIVRVGKEHHLLGVSDQNINYLTSISEDQLGDIESDVQSMPKKQRTSFLELLQGKSFGKTSSGLKSSQDFEGKS